MGNTIQNFQIDSLNMRARLVRFDTILDDIIGQHNYPDWVGFALAEAIVINAAIASSIKLSGKLSLQIQSEGAIKMISTDYDATTGTPTMRGYVRYDEARHKAGEPNFKNGIFGILINLGGGAQPYQGITALSDSLTQSAIDYFANSEQIPTKFHIDVVKDTMKDEWHGSAMMVQQIAVGGAGNTGRNNADNLRKVEAVLSTIAREELHAGEISGEQLFYRLFHEDNPTANPAFTVDFGCPCSVERVKNSLSIYSRRDLETMITDEGTITADCQFCGAHYIMNPDEVGFEAE